MYRRNKARQLTVKGTERTPIMNSQAARVIRHFCLATRENENEVKRQYNATPAPLKHKALAYLQAATKELREYREAQQDAADMIGLYHQGSPAA